MPLEQQDPPQEKMVRQILTPDHTDSFYTELVSRESTRFQANSPIKHGLPYNETVGADQGVVDAYGSTLFFIREDVPLAGTIRGMEGDKFVKWTWATSASSESSYNAAASYLSESTSCPVFARIYTIRRSVYEATPFLTIGSTLTGLTGVNITAGGTGYTGIVTGTVGTGATVEFIISGGVLVGAIVTNEGTSVTNGGSITISTTGAGSGATAIARIQPAIAVLVSQKKDELPDNDPNALEFVRVIRVYQTLPGPPLAEQDYDLGRDIPIPKTRQVVATANAGIGTNRREVKAIDSVQSEITDYDLTALTIFFSTYYTSNAAMLEGVDLPDVLQSISVIWENTKGDGNYSSDASGYSTGTSASLSLSENGNSEASAIVIPDLLPIIKTYPRKVPGIDYFFYLAINSTLAQVKTRLGIIIGSTVNTWPVFKAEPLEFTLIGRQVSVTAKADVQQHESVSPDNFTITKTTGSGASESIGSSVRTKSISPTIHAAITLSSTTNTASGTASSTVGWPNGTNWPALTATSTESATAVGGISPTSATATSPSSVPISGYYLYRLNPGPSFLGFTPYHCEVIDMSVFA